jgi:hypothetical protein
MARLSDDEIQRRFQAELENSKLSDEEALVRWPDLTPEKREINKKKSEAISARHRTIIDDETGQRLVGGPQPNSGKKTKQSVAEKITELADGERQTEIINALFAPLARSEPAAVRGKGAERILKISAEQREANRRDREELRQLGREELIKRLAVGIMSSDMAGDLLVGIAQRHAELQSASYDVDGTIADS